MTRDTRLVITTLTSLLAALTPWPAAASGVAQKLPLKEAVARASIVLVVELASPPARQVAKRYPYADRKTKRQQTLTVTRTLHRFKVVQVLRAPKTEPKLGTTIDVRDSNAQLGEMVHVAMKTTGSWPIPIIPQLEGQATAVKGGRYVLLIGGHDTQDKLYLGVGGLGLLPLTQQAEVTRLLAAGRR